MNTSVQHEIGLAYLTGTAEVVSSDFLVSIIRPNAKPAYSIGQMLFKPYESSKEFMYAAQNTIPTMLLIGCAIISPISTALILPTFLSLSFAMYSITSLTKNQFCLDLANQFYYAAMQNIINLIVLPFSATAMLTRGLSTGLKAAGICDYDAPELPIAKPV